MSNSSLPDHRTVLPERSERSLADAVLRPVKGAAFWAAVALPFLHIPLLATGLESTASLTAFGALVSLNVLALLVGHPYGAE
jgi:hypothetical protein